LLSRFQACVAAIEEWNDRQSLGALVAQVDSVTGGGVPGAHAVSSTPASTTSSIRHQAKPAAAAKNKQAAALPALSVQQQQQQQQQTLMQRQQHDLAEFKKLDRELESLASTFEDLSRIIHVC